MYNGSSSAPEAVESSALSFEGVDHIESSHGLSLGMLSVGDRVTDHIFEEGPENISTFIIDVSRDSLDSASSSDSPDRRLGDSHDRLFELSLR